MENILINIKDGEVMTLQGLDTVRPKGLKTY